MCIERLYTVSVGQAPAHITWSLMTTKHELLSSIVQEYMKNDDMDGLVDEILIYFPDINTHDLRMWYDDLLSIEE
jgi:hypothetical protein